MGFGGPWAGRGATAQGGGSLALFSGKQVTRDYDEEEQGYDSEKEKKEEKKPVEAGSPKTKECAVEKSAGDVLRESKVNGDDHHEEDMDMSD